MRYVYLIALLLVPIAAQEKPLTIADIEPALAGTSIGEQIGFSDEEGFVTYMEIGKPSYDDFFMTSAKLNGLSLLAKQMTSTATGELKKYAKSKVADEAMQENIKELVGDIPPDEWSTEQSFAVMRMAKEQDRLSKDEVKYFATTSISIGIVAASLAKGIGEVVNLIEDGTALLKNIRKAKLKLRQIPAATKGLKGSIENLQDFKNNAPKAAEEMVVLAEGFKMLAEL